MSREVGRTFNLVAGQCIVTIEDDSGTKSVHTIQLLEPNGDEADVQAHIERHLAEAKAREQKIKRVAIRHGWKP